jgi:hypothetical protein
LKAFVEDKNYPKLMLLEKLGYALRIVGNDDFILGGNISHLGYNQKKKGGGGACDKNKGFFLGKRWPFVAKL